MHSCTSFVSPKQPRLTTTHAGRLTRFQIQRMDLEARSLPVGVKTPLLNTLRDYKVRTFECAPAWLPPALTGGNLSAVPSPDECCEPEGDGEEGWRVSDGPGGQS